MQCFYTAKGCCSDCNREGKRTWSLVARINDSGGSLPCGIGTWSRFAKGIVIGDPTWCPLYRWIRRSCRRRIGVYARRRCDRTVSVLYILYINNTRKKLAIRSMKSTLRSAHHERYSGCVMNMEKKYGKNSSEFCLNFMSF